MRPIRSACDAELDGITAGSLRIGAFNSGTISFTAAIAPAGTTRLELMMGADIIDGNAGTDVTVARLAMTAGTGIGVTHLVMSTAVGQLEAQTTTGGVTIANVGAVTVGGVSGNLAGLRVVTSGDVSLTPSVPSRWRTSTARRSWPRAPIRATSC